MLLAAVEVVTRVAEERQALAERLDLGELLGEEELVLHGGHRRLQPVELPDLVEAVAARVHEALALDVALGGAHGPPVGRGLEADDLGVAEDLPAVPSAGAAQPVDQAGGVDVAVDRVPQPAGEALHVEQRVQLGHLRGAEHLEVDAHPLRHADEVAVAVEVGLVVAEPDPSVVAPVGDRRLGVGGESRVELDGVLLQPDHRLDGAELGHLAGGVPGRSRRQLVALDEHDVAPPVLGEVIEGAGATDAATDHDDACPTRKVRHVPAPGICGRVVVDGPSELLDAGRDRGGRKAREAEAHRVARHGVGQIARCAGLDEHAPIGGRARRGRWRRAAAARATTARRHRQGSPPPSPGGWTRQRPRSPSAPGSCSGPGAGRGRSRRAR